MKHVKLSDELVEVLTAEASERLAGNMKGPAPKDRQQLLAKYRKERKAGTVTDDYDPDVAFLEAMYAAKPAGEPADISAPLTITLPPRLAATVRWQAFVEGQSATEYSLERLADSVADIAEVVYSGTSKDVVAWLLEGDRVGDAPASPGTVQCSFTAAQLRRLEGAAALLSKRGKHVTVPELVTAGALHGLDWPNDPATDSIPVLRDLVEAYARNGATFAEPEYGTDHPLQAYRASKKKKSNAGVKGGAA